MPRKGLPPKLQDWVDAPSRHHLSHAHVQMARELGMNPRKLGGIDNDRQEPWKAPLPVFIERLYLRRLGRERPEAVLSVEEGFARAQAKKAARKARRSECRLAAGDRHPACPLGAGAGAGRGDPAPGM